MHPFINIEAILFDMDGTLIDTDDQAVEKLANWLRPLLNDNATQTARWLLMQAETPGNLFITLLDFLGLDGPLMHFTDRLRRKRGVYPADEFRLIEGVEESILRLSEHYPIAIVTTRSRYHIDQFCQQFSTLAPIIKVTCGLQDTRRLKPHPAPVQLAASRLGVPVANCLMVGDTAVDVKAARRAGAWSIGVLCGFGQRKELNRAGAHVILESTAQVADLLL